MKSGMLIPLILLSLVIHQVKGMGFITKGSFLQSSNHHFTTHENPTVEDAIKEVNMAWKTKFSGRARKLMLTTTTTISKNEKKTKKSEQPSAADRTYPGILDLAGMDYSQARRKPPIHN